MNTRHLYIVKTTAKMVLMFSAGLALLLLAAGCAENFGRISWDDNVTQAFENNQVGPDYNFYQYTIGMRVFAIVGLDPELEMQSRLWRELAADTEDFQVATSRMWYNYTRVQEEPRGAVILNPAGENVGVYFSSLRFISIEFGPQNQVSLLLDTTPVRGGPDDRRVP